MLSHSVENEVEGVRYFRSREALRESGDCLTRFRGREESRIESMKSSAKESALLAERCTLSSASTRESAIEILGVPKWQVRVVIGT